jgi:hypothetical protein
MAAVLVGCGGSRDLTTSSSASSARAQQIAAHLARGRSWMLEEASSDDLVYVSEQGVWGHQEVLVYSYPQAKLVGELQPDTEETYEGLCSDSSGHVFVVGWITNGQAFYDEYAHGGSEPINDIIATGVPSGCSLDPSTGNLAVANYVDFNEGRHGDVAVYADAAGEPTDYSDATVPHYYFCAYDDKGNLFADGDSSVLNELPKKSANMTSVYFNHNITPGSLQWNDGDLAVAVVGGAKGPTRIDRVTVAGSGAQIVGTTNLVSYHNEGTYLDVQFWIQGTRIIGPAPNAAGPTHALNFWPYPAGGKAIKTVTAPSNGNFYGVAFSAAP